MARLLPGFVQEVAQESISSNMLIKMGINNPDFIPTIMRLYPQHAPLNYILDVKGMKTKGLHHETNTQRYRTVGSNHVKFLIDQPDYVIPKFTANLDGVTFVDPVNGTTNIGKGKTPFFIYSNSNWAGFQEIVELADNETQLYILEDPEEESNGVWKHKVRLWSNNTNDTVPIRLLSEGMEYMAGMTAHEQDFSVRGTEKYVNKGMGDAYLTLQRFKYSWSGTAKAMKQQYRSVVGKNGAISFLTEAEDLMMKRAAQNLNYQYIWGKTSVTEDRKVVMFNNRNQEVLAGSGIVYSNDGPIKIPYFGWTKSTLQMIITEIRDYIGPDMEGNIEVVALMGTKSYMSFQTLMGELGKTQNNNIEGTGADKGVIDTYKFYELGGIRIIAMLEPTMSKDRPGERLADGTKHNEWDCILLPLKATNQGNNGVELIQLRPMASGTVAGIDEGGNIASSVDGSSKHILFQNGIINQNQVFWMKRPY